MLKIGPLWIRKDTLQKRYQFEIKITFIFKLSSNSQTSGKADLRKNDAAI